MLRRGLPEERPKARRRLHAVSLSSKGQDGGEPESGSPAFFTLCADLPSHHFHQTVADGKTQVLVSKEASEGPLFMRRRLEQTEVPTFADADGGRTNVEQESRRPIVTAQQIRSYRNKASPFTHQSV